jgi:hypothetical protein
MASYRQSIYNVRSRKSSHQKKLEENGKKIRRSNMSYLPELPENSRE